MMVFTTFSSSASYVAIQEVHRGAGVIASWFGLGGGIVKGPIMFEMGILPEVAAATSSAMMVFTTFSSSASYVAIQEVLVWYATAMFAMSVVSSVAGQFLLKKLIDSLGRPSLVVFLFAIIAVLGLVGMAISSSGDIVAIFHGKIGGFRPICG